MRRIRVGSSARRHRASIPTENFSPTGGPTFVELDYSTDISLTVGMTFEQNGSTSFAEPWVVLVPTTAEGGVRGTRSTSTYPRSSTAAVSRPADVYLDAVLPSGQGTVACVFGQLQTGSTHTMRTEGSLVARYVLADLFGSALAWTPLLRLPEDGTWSRSSSVIAVPSTFDANFYKGLVLIPLFWFGLVHHDGWLPRDPTSLPDHGIGADLADQPDRCDRDLLRPTPG